MAGGLRRMAVRLALASAVVVTAALVALPLLANVPDEEWPFYKPVELPGSLAGTGLVEVELDREVYTHASPGLGDIRVVEKDAGREVPYKMLVESGDHRRSAVAVKMRGPGHVRRGAMSVKMRDLGHVPGWETSFILDLQSEGTLHNEVEVNTSSENFQRRVKIEGSDDGKTWRMLEQTGTIFDLTIQERRFTNSDTRVRYPSSTARFLRVRIIDGEEEPLDIEGAVVFFTQELSPRITEVPLLIAAREEDQDRKETVLTLDLGSSGFPAKGVQLEVPQRNFYRRVLVEGSDDQTTWLPVQGSETIYDFDTPKFVGRDSWIGFRESRYRYYRVFVMNEDNPPLDIEKASARGHQRKLVFAVDSEKSYRLYYGNENVNAPSYELERMFPYLVTEGLPEARLGFHTLNPAFTVPATPPVPFTERYPWLLPTVVAIAALVIGVFLATLVRQLGSNLRPPEAAE